jgi:hypothetical protein
MGSEDDARWGRLEGAAPPLGRRAPLVWWLAATSVAAVVVIAVVGGPGRLDDAQLGDQRNGFLIDVEDARRVSGLLLPGDPIGRRPVFVGFARAAPLASALEAIRGRLPPGFAAVLVVAEPGRAEGPLRSVEDPRGRIAATVGVDRPRDGGPPIGYAVVDGSALVRYATIDPSWPDQGFEIELITKAAG